MVVSYYIYVVMFSVFIVTNLVETCLYIIFFNVLFVMLLWSFLKTIFTCNATVPPKYKLTDEEFELLEESDDKNPILERICERNNLTVQLRYPPDVISYCGKCKHIKPDRAHHCSSCRVCVLKMDHHCPWVNNCIGFSNYKSFILLLFYTTLYCAYIICTCINYVMGFLLETVVIVSLVVVALYFMAGMMLLGSHCFMLAKNKTIIDDLQKKIFVIGNATFDLGCRKNFLEVFGNKWVLWPFPIHTTLGNGYTFDIKMLNDDSSHV